MLKVEVVFTKIECDSEGNDSTIIAGINPSVRSGVHSQLCNFRVAPRSLLLLLAFSCY